jgi:hypothetical protein
MFKKLLLIVLLSGCLETASRAADFLLYLEAQGVGGYSSQERGVVYYSETREDVMQKPSLGVDYLQRFSGDSGDVAALALQARLAYDLEGTDNAELQLYNAYFKYKAGWSDLWIGHNRPAMGLSSYFDSHGLLLNTLAMNQFGFDRDWGVGAYRDFDWGNISVSVTTGTGMPIYFKGNHLAAARISKGTLNQDNYNLGFSLSYGKTLDTMGYHLMNDEPMRFAMVGTDFTYLWNNLESRMEVMGGRNKDEESYSAFWRIGINLLDEGRLRLEIQPAMWRIVSDRNYQISAGPSFMLTGDISLRAMYQYDHNTDDHRVIVQIYYYRKL